MFFGDLLLLLTAIWIFRRVFQWLRFPSLFGEIFAGFVVGPMMLGWVTETEAIRVLAELGVFFLMFHAGLEFAPDDILKTFKGALRIAIGGILLPFTLVLGFAIFYGFDPFVSSFIALILSVSAVEIAARMFKESKLNRLKMSKYALTAALLTEVLLLMLFPVYLEVFQTKAFDLQHLLLLLFKVFAYFGVVFWIWQNGSHFLHRFLYKGNKGFTLTLIVALTLSVFAEMIGLHFIIGAFLAGLVLQKELIDVEMYDKLEDRVFGFSYSFLGPVFFATLAFHLNFHSLMLAPVFVGGIFALSMLGKMIGGGYPAYTRRKGILEALAIGLSINTRGALALIFVAIGYEEGIITEEIFSILIVVLLGTTFLSYLLFKPLAKKIRHDQALGLNSSLD
jgi:Kef-type K+ transport system membrane component KefB